jgi:hypothetical protein
MLKYWIVVAGQLPPDDAAFAVVAEAAFAVVAAAAFAVVAEAAALAVVAAAAAAFVVVPEPDEDPHPQVSPAAMVTAIKAENNFLILITLSSFVFFIHRTRHAAGPLQPEELIFRSQYRKVFSGSRIRKQ